MPRNLRVTGIGGGLVLLLITLCTPQAGTSPLCLCNLWQVATWKLQQLNKSLNQRNSFSNALLSIINLTHSIKTNYFTCFHSIHKVINTNNTHVRGKTSCHSLWLNIMLNIRKQC